jgi:hypothetical protein
VENERIFIFPESGFTLFKNDELILLIIAAVKEV